MRMMARISIPVEAGNRGIIEGTLPKVVQEFTERWKPEAAYFTAFEGRRTVFAVFDMADSSVMPAFSEPFFSQFNAEVEFMPVMNVDDLQKGLSELSR